MDKQIIIKHISDKHERKLTLNEAFLETLSISKYGVSKIEDQESDLLFYLQKYPSFIDNISDEYKKRIIESWGYKVLIVA